MDHKTTKLVQSGHLQAPLLSTRSGSGRPAPSIRASENATVVYAESGATIGEWTGKTGWAAEGDSPLDRVSLGGFLEATGPIWFMATLALGLLLIWRR